MSGGLRDQTAAAIGDHEGWQRPDQSWECACGQTFGIKLKHSEHVADAVLALLTEEWGIKYGTGIMRQWVTGQDVTWRSSADVQERIDFLNKFDDDEYLGAALARRWVSGWSVVAGEQP